MTGQAAGATARALADTSLFIALEQGRPVEPRAPLDLAVSVITVGELRLGVLGAADGKARALRLNTLSHVETLDPLPVDREVAGAWAALRVVLRDHGRRMPLNDSWIAATAIAHELPIVTQDDDYAEVPGLTVIRV